jgi:hypothetical protein
MTVRAKRASASFSSYAAASVLAVITLGVFFRLQDYGPESAIRRFHNDVLNDDSSDLQRVTVQSIGDQRVRRLVSLVHNLLVDGRRYQLVGMDRTPDQVRAAVIYRIPRREDRAIVWVVERSDGGWRVNADKTITILEDWSRPG